LFCNFYEIEFGVVEQFYPRGILSRFEDNGLAINGLSFFHPIAIGFHIFHIPSRLMRDQVSLKIEHTIA